MPAEVPASSRGPVVRWGTICPACFITVIIMISITMAARPVKPLAYEML